jgi:hypothetical protein
MMKLADDAAELLLAKQAEMAFRHSCFSVSINEYFLAFSGTLDSVTTLPHSTVREPPNRAATLRKGGFFADGP